MKNTLLTFALICSMVSSHAAGVYSALVPDQADTHVLVTLIDRACDSTNGNATVRNPNKSLKGCWVQDGLTFRVSIHETNEVLIFPRSEFKYMGDPALSAAPKKQAESSFATTLTCVADGWTGDVTVERNPDSTLKTVFVSGEKVNATEQANIINFSYNGLNISLSTLTGTFNYDTAGFQSFLNFKMGRANAKGAGVCAQNNLKKKF